MRAPDTVEPLPLRVWLRSTATVLVCLALLIAVYLIAVWTPAGQRFEDAVLDAARRDGTNAARATGTLDTVSVPSILVALAVVVAIALLRRRPLLGGLAVGVVAASILTTEVIQRSVLRPILLARGWRREDQSFPSGHTAAAMSVMCALVLVTPYRWRGVTLLLASLGAASIEVATVTASWHRPSDTIGSDLIVLCYLCVAVAVLARLGRVGEAALPTRRRRTARALLTAGYGATAVVAFVIAAFTTGAAAGRLTVADPAVTGAAAGSGTVLTAGRSLALAGSAALAFALLAVLRGVDLSPPARAPGTR